MAKITFSKSNVSVVVQDGCELLKAAEQHPELPLRFGCTRGDCGVCAIQVESGGENLTKCSRHEKATLKKVGCVGEGYRLACQCALNGDVIITK